MWACHKMSETHLSTKIISPVRRRCKSVPVTFPLKCIYHLVLLTNLLKLLSFKYNCFLFLNVNVFSLKQKMRGANYHCIFLIAAFCMYRLWFNFTTRTDVWEKRNVSVSDLRSAEGHWTFFALCLSLQQMLISFFKHPFLNAERFLVLKEAAVAVRICLMKSLVDWLWLIVVALPPSTLLWSKTGAWRVLEKLPIRRSVTH